MGYNWAWFSGTVDCSGLTEYSDERMKQNIATLKYNDCKELLDNLDAKVYDKTFPDTKQEIGFIAQDVKSSLSPENPLNTLVHTASMSMPDIGDDVLTLCYSKMTAVLWTIVKQQEQRIKALEALVANKKPKT